MSDSKMFDYIVHGGDKIAELEASLEHMGGVLSREIELNAEQRAEIERLQAALKPFADILTEAEKEQPDDPRERLMHCRWGMTLYEFQKARIALEQKADTE